MTRVPPSHHTVSGRVAVASVLAALPILLQGLFPGVVSASLLPGHPADPGMERHEAQRRNAVGELLRGSAPSDGEVIPRMPSLLLRYEDLDMGDRARIRDSARAGGCPASLLDVLPGFYDLCLAILENEGGGSAHP